MIIRMKKKILLLSLVLSVICFPGVSYSENCMWDQSCDDEKFNLEFCGNGRCEPFETKNTCLEDCGTIIDIVISNIRSTADGIDGGGGIFGGVQRSAIIFMIMLVVLFFALAIFGVILIAIYNKVVASIEKEVIID